MSDARPGWLSTRTLGLLACVTLGVGACASVRPVAVTPAATAMPVAIAGYDWFYNADAGEARLAYGLAESDDVPLGLSCVEGSGRLELSATAPTGASEIHIESGGQTQRFPAKSEPSEIHEGVFLTADVDADAAVFQQFRRTGWLTLVQGSGRRALSPQPGSVGSIERFFGKCG